MKGEMRNAKKFDERITIGTVPGHEELLWLRESGFRTIVDLRGERELGDDDLGRRAAELGMRYASVPVAVEAIEREPVAGFYRVVFAQGAAPLYLFSCDGKRPLALLLLLDAVARGDRAPTIYRRASWFGTDLAGDDALREFLERLLASGELRPIYLSLRTLRPDLFEPRWSRPRASARVSATEPILTALTVVSQQWVQTGDRAALRAALEQLVATLD